MDLNLKKFIHSDSDEDHNIEEYSHSIDVDIIEGSDSFHLVFDLPGFTLEDISVSVVNSDLLKVTGLRKSNLLALESYILEERFKGKFEKEIVLPEGLDLENIKNDFQNGVLRLSFQKVV